ncbi:MAG: hypothetical protein JSV97_06070, partial [candidate division WOR-3 bacterium]
STIPPHSLRPTTYALLPRTYTLRNTVSWDGVDDADRKLPSGVYFLKSTAGDYQQTEKLLLIR